LRKLAGQLDSLQALAFATIGATGLLLGAAPPMSRKSPCATTCGFDPPPWAAQIKSLRPVPPPGTSLALDATPVDRLVPRTEPHNCGRPSLMRRCCVAS
jgi:hypothetical protein